MTAFVAVPEFTRSVNIKLNERVLLRRSLEPLTFAQTWFWTEGSMTRRRSLILSIGTAGCWIILLAIVLSSVFAASNFAKQIRTKDRQSTQGR